MEVDLLLKWVFKIKAHRKISMKKGSVGKERERGGAFPVLIDLFISAVFSDSQEDADDDDDDEDELDRRILIALQRFLMRHEKLD